MGDYANYQQGLVDLRVGNERWAKTHFVKLTEGGVEASRAKFALAGHPAEERQGRRTTR